MKIAIASGKGGTGKTTLAVNLATYAAESFSVQLADVDVEEPNSGIFLKGTPFLERIISKLSPEWQKDLCISCGLCKNYCNFNAIVQLDKEIIVMPKLCHSCFACSELCPTQALPMKPDAIGVLSHNKFSQMDFVESRLNIGIEQAVPLITQTIDYLDTIEPKADWQILDCPPGTSCPMIAATQPADFVLLVSEPTPFGLHDLQLAVETMKQMKKPFAVAINRVGIGNDDIFNYCDENDIPIVTKIRNKRSIAELYSQGKIIYQQEPEFKQNLEDIVQFIKKKAICTKS